jgi:hypothetical protein
MEKYQQDPKYQLFFLLELLKCGTREHEADIFHFNFPANNVCGHLFFLADATVRSLSGPAQLSGTQ